MERKRICPYRLNKKRLLANLSVCFADSSPTEGSLWRRGKVSG